VIAEVFWSHQVLNVRESCSLQYAAMRAVHAHITPQQQQQSSEHQKSVTTRCTVASAPEIHGRCDIAPLSSTSKNGRVGMRRTERQSATIEPKAHL
jgi:hypothetical protein